MTRAVFCALAAAVLMSACGGSPEKSCDYSYSLSVKNHEIIVSKLANEKFFLKVDGKLYEPKTRRPQPGGPPGGGNPFSAAYLKDVTVVLSNSGRVLYANTARSDRDDNHEVSIDATPAGEKQPSTKGMSSLTMDGKRVYYDKSRIQDGATYWFFVHYFRTKDYVYSISQMVFSDSRPKPLPEPFASALKSFKLRRTKQ